MSENFMKAEGTVASIRAIKSSGKPNRIKFSDNSTVIVDVKTAHVIVKYLDSIEIPEKRKMAEKLNNNLVDFMNVLDYAYTKVYG